MPTTSIDLTAAAEKLSSAFIAIWNESTLRAHCEKILDNQTLESKRKKTLYNTYCTEPWQVIVWCYCSMNTKGSSKASKDWTENNGFKEMIELFKKFVLSPTKNEREKFLAINLILRYYAGGKFLTISQKLVENFYLDNREELTENILLEKINNEKSFDLKSYENKPQKADSWVLYKILEKHKFNPFHINEEFENLSIINSSEEAIIKKLEGLGSKYSRNVKMDIRTPDSESFIAIDKRIKEVLNKVGLNLNVDRYYDKIERFLVKDVVEAKLSKVIAPAYTSRPEGLNGITPWELDRLLYNLGDSSILENYLSK